MENASNSEESDKSPTSRIEELPTLLLAIESLCESLGIVFVKGDAEEILYRGMEFDSTYTTLSWWNWYRVGLV